MTDGSRHPDAGGRDVHPGRASGRRMLRRRATDEGLRDAQSRATATPNWTRCRPTRCRIPSGAATRCRSATCVPARWCSTWGAGPGIDLLLAAEKVGPDGRVIGVDMTDEMIARARANAVAAGRDQHRRAQGLHRGPARGRRLGRRGHLELRAQPVARQAGRLRRDRPGAQARRPDAGIGPRRRGPAAMGAGLGDRCTARAWPAPSRKRSTWPGCGPPGWSEVEVVQRLVYDQAMLHGLIASEVEEGGDALVAEARGCPGRRWCGCGCASDRRTRARRCSAPSSATSCCGARPKRWRARWRACWSRPCAPPDRSSSPRERPRPLLDPPSGGVEVAAAPQGVGHLLLELGCEALEVEARLAFEQP